jgi:hypothetical protein
MEFNKMLLSARLQDVQGLDSTMHTSNVRTQGHLECSMYGVM